MNEINNMRAITLKDLWDLFIHRIAVIALAAVIAAGSLFVVDKITIKPMYASTATMYILRQSGSENSSSGEAANELTLALRLMYDCNYLLKSRTVLNTVIEDMDLDMTYYELSSRISTANPTNTRILEITAEAETPELAKAIVDKICEIGPDKIQDAMGFSQVNLYEYGTLPKDPCNNPGLMKYAVIAVAAAVAVYAVFLMMFILDDRIRTEEDIERYLGLSILAEIPDFNADTKGRYGYYRGAKPYGAYQAAGGKKSSAKKKTAGKKG